jgi:hypothetical protein
VLDAVSELDANSTNYLTLSLRDRRTDLIAAAYDLGIGNFPNSPVNLEHIFRLEGGRIASLEIR